MAIRPIGSGSERSRISTTRSKLEFGGSLLPCAERDIRPEIEMTSMQDINKAWDRVVKGDVKYRFVIDMATLKNGQKAA